MVKIKQNGRNTIGLRQMASYKEFVGSYEEYLGETVVSKEDRVIIMKHRSLGISTLLADQSITKDNKYLFFCKSGENGKLVWSGQEDPDSWEARIKEFNRTSTCT